MVSCFNFQKLAFKVNKFSIPCPNSEKKIMTSPFPHNSTKIDILSDAFRDTLKFTEKISSKMN